jgi:hypothetical protein
MNTPQNIPSHDAISTRARDIWESSGQIDGQDLTNWLRAEKELLDEASNSANKGSPLKENGISETDASRASEAEATSWPRDRGNREQIPDTGKSRNRR